MAPAHSARLSSTPATSPTIQSATLKRRSTPASGKATAAAPSRASKPR